MIRDTPTLIKWFLPGFICCVIYMWLFKRKMESLYVVGLSVCISVGIRSFYEFVYDIFLNSMHIASSIKDWICIVIGIILPCALFRVYHSRAYKDWLLKYNQETINEDVFDDVVDYVGGTAANVYLKNSNIMYAGTLSYKGDGKSWKYICLIDYISEDTDSHSVISDPDGDPSSVVINLDDVERMELFYHKDSEIWKNLTKN